MRKILVAFTMLATISAASPAYTQEDPMQVQRCIWSCLSDSKGADDPAYHRCVARHCAEETVPQSDAATASQQARKAHKVLGAWVYGDHPVLGRSAHVQTKAGAIGLTCEYHGNNQAMVEILSLRVTNGMFKGKSLVYMVEGGKAAGTIKRAEGNAFSEIKGNSCDVALSEFGQGSSVIIVDGEIGGINSVDGKMEFTISQAGKTTIVTSAQDARARLDGQALSLKGSSAAIKRLLRECPAARRDIENNCGI